MKMSSAIQCYIKLGKLRWRVKLIFIARKKLNFLPLSLMCPHGTQINYLQIITQNGGVQISGAHGTQKCLLSSCCIHSTVSMVLNLCSNLIILYLFCNALCVKCFTSQSPLDHNPETVVKTKLVLLRYLRYDIHECKILYIRKIKRKQSPQTLVKQNDLEKSPIASILRLLKIL